MTSRQSAFVYGGSQAEHASPAVAVDQEGLLLNSANRSADVYFSADVETDGPIPGQFSMLSFALVCAGSFDGSSFRVPENYDRAFYRELRPIAPDYQPEALAVNGLDREQLKLVGADPADAMTDAAKWVLANSAGGEPVLVAYPLSFDWSWLYWYFIRFARQDSPFSHSRCYDLKTAYAVKARSTIAASGRSRLPAELRPAAHHTHNAKDDAVEQARIFARVFEWEPPR